MHRVTMPDGTRQPDRLLRVLRPSAYGLMGTAGVLLLFSPMMWQELGTIAIFMSAFLALGGVLACIGCVTERWVGEYIGIPLLTSSFTVFGVIQSASALHVAPLAALANLAILVGVSLGLWGRWREVRAVYRLAVHVAHKEIRL